MKLRMVGLTGLCGVILSLASGAVAERTFVHPGILHKKSDLDRMKYMVASGMEPWSTSFATLSAKGSASYAYKVRKDPEDHSLSRENPRHQRNQYEDDALAAYHNALMWYITGDQRHAEKSIEILNAWSHLTNFYGGGTQPLCAGLYGTPLINAAEIIKSTYDGWAAEDIQKFKDMLVYPGYSTTTAPHGQHITFYWNTYMGDPGRHGNQGLLAWRTVMAIGIFCDNEIIYDRAKNYILGLPHRADDLPYTSGPAIYDSSPTSEYKYYNEYRTTGRDDRIDDYGFDDQIQHYIYENGQCQESSRDQSHSCLGISAVNEMMEVVWNQGEDIYSYLDDRLLKGLDFTIKYNLTYVQTYPDQPSVWEPTDYQKIMTRCGRWKSLAINPHIAANYERISRGKDRITTPQFEMPYAHYTVRMGLTDDAKWVARARDYSVAAVGYETGDGLDRPGWGGLTYRRPDFCAGDPIRGFENGSPVFDLPVLPATIEAENYDFFSGEAEGRTYHDTSEGNRSGGYRTDDVDIVEIPGEGYALTQMERGEWLTYTVHVAESGKYDIAVRYLARDTGGIRIDFNGSNVVANALLPVTEGKAWNSHGIGQNIGLKQGVQSMRVSVSAGKAAYILDHISIRSSEMPRSPVEEIMAEDEVLPTLSTQVVAAVESPIRPEPVAEDHSPISRITDVWNSKLRPVILIVALGLIVSLGLLTRRKKK